MSPSDFNQIAKRYDLINQVVSFGLVNFWRKWFLRNFIKSVDIEYLKQNSIKYCDYACGTGKTTKQFIKNLSKKGISFDEVLGRDYSEDMLNIAKSKKYKTEVNFEKADAMFTPVGSELNKFDIITCSFGIRNFSDPVKAIRNFGVSLKEGGYLAVLEFSMPKLLMKPFILMYYYFILWRIAWILGGDSKAYRYLGRSISRWYSFNSLNYIFESTPDLEKVLVKRSLFGIVALNIFRKKLKQSRETTGNINLKPLRNVKIMGQK